MADILDIIENINTIYNSNSSLAILKDYERVFDELDLYVFENWREGELVSGPQIERHWITCSFMWPEDKMPNPEAAKRLSEYGCGVKYKRDVLIQPRKIKSLKTFVQALKRVNLTKVQYGWLKFPCLKINVRYLPRIS